MGEGVDDSEWLMVADLALTRIRTAGVRDAETVHTIAQQAIRKIYPSCYEPAIVEAFCRLHSVDAIVSDISNARVFLLEDEGRPIGTGTLDGCHVARVFVLPGGGALLHLPWGAGCPRLGNLSDTTLVIHPSMQQQRFS